MHLGFTAFNVGMLATPEFGRLAHLADELGYESLWTAEHIVLPRLTARAGGPTLDRRHDAVSRLNRRAGLSGRTYQPESS